jgi:hypothetical protein
VDAGVWNYNPTTYDMTQAYTNPIYALLSIIPNLFEIDIVLFFKLLSIMNFILFSMFYIKRIGKPFLFLCFCALPATMIHLFSGLETFLFVSLFTALCICLYENKFKSSLFLAVLLMVTRPEAWLLALLIPLYYLIEGFEQRDTSASKYGFRFFFMKSEGRDKALISIILLPAILFILLQIHRHHFGSALPNTYFIKHGNSFDLRNFRSFMLFSLPLYYIAFLTKSRVVAVLIAFSTTISIIYSTSHLSMNFAGRFSYHIFAPIFLLMTLRLFTTWRSRCIQPRFLGERPSKYPFSFASLS